ncbi:MAG: Fpg/Nei family DNA glycosylase [Anaerolineales bacterium]
MPELPEIRNLARQMQAALVGKRITGSDVLQPKSLNLPVGEFTAALAGNTIGAVTSRGKWLRLDLAQGRLFLNLGMGGEVLLVSRNNLPAKRRLVLDFDDDTSLSINFWWFGYAHYAQVPDEHEPTSKLGPDALDLDVDELHALLKGRRGRIKNYLLDQSVVAGIGNFYVHDILFRAGLHPLRTANTLSREDVEVLHAAIHEGLQSSLERGGAFYEVDLYGQQGGFRQDAILVGYREGEPCPRCDTSVEKIKTGSTSSYICPHCQPLDA